MANIIVAQFGGEFDQNFDPSAGGMVTEPKGVLDCVLESVSYTFNSASDIINNTNDTYRGKKSFLISGSGNWTQGNIDLKAPNGSIIESIWVWSKLSVSEKPKYVETMVDSSSHVFDFVKPPPPNSGYVGVDILCVIKEGVPADDPYYLKFEQFNGLFENFYDIELGHNVQHADECVDADKFTISGEVLSVPFALDVPNKDGFNYSYYSVSSSKTFTMFDFTIKPISGYKLVAVWISTSLKEDYKEQELLVTNEFHFEEFSPSPFENVRVAVIVDVDSGGGDEDDLISGKVSNVYCVQTNEELAQLKRESFSFFLAGESEGNNVVDFSQFIGGAYQIPFTIGGDVLSEKQRVIAGKEKFELYLKVVKDDVIEIDLGIIDVPSYFNNGLDFVNTECSLIVPFMGDIISLNSEDCFNNKLHVVYKLECVNAKISVVVRNEQKIIYMGVMGVGREFPLINIENINTVKSFDNGIDNGLFSAVLDVLLPEYGKLPTVIKTGKLSDFTGLVTVKNALVEFGDYFDENQMLIDMLENGVFKND